MKNGYIPKYESLHRGMTGRIPVRVVDGRIESYRRGCWRQVPESVVGSVVWIEAG